MTLASLIAVGASPEHSLARRKMENVAFDVNSEPSFPPKLALIILAK